MIEIIPNWHPIFVHFTVALIVTSAILYLVGNFTATLKWGQELLITARWCLWLGAFAAIATIIAGLIAYYTVAHDTASHLAMTEHRNWAIATVIVILCVALWSWRLIYKHKSTPILFIIAMIAVAGLVMVTAWHGAEVVYRYGIGVQSLPQVSGTGHAHDHAKPEPKDEKTQKSITHTHDNHDHHRQ